MPLYSLENYCRPYRALFSVGHVTQGDASLCPGLGYDGLTALGISLEYTGPLTKLELLFHFPSTTLPSRFLFKG